MNSHRPPHVWAGALAMSPPALMAACAGSVGLDQGWRAPLSKSPLKKTGGIATRNLYGFSQSHKRSAETAVNLTLTALFPILEGVTPLPVRGLREWKAHRYGVPAPAATPLYLPTHTPTKGHPVTTETAQRRLIEALAELYKTPDLDIGQASDPLESLQIGILAAAEFSTAMGQSQLVAPYLAFAAVVGAVRDDQREVASNG